MSGPNQWSDEHKRLVVLKIRLEKEMSLPSSLPLVFAELLDGTGVPMDSADIPEPLRMVARLACEFQLRSAMAVEFCKVLPCRQPQDFFLIYSYQLEQAGVEAGHAAVNMVNELCEGRIPDIKATVEEMRRLRSKYQVGPTSNYILEEIKRRSIPFRQYDFGSLVSIGYGCRQRKIRTAVTDSTSGLGIEMAGDKEETKKILALNNCPVPHGIVVSSVAELQCRLPEVNFPIVIKPLDGNHGRGVSTNINTFQKALDGFEIAHRISEQVIVEECIRGEDYRFLVVDYKLIAVARRTPAYVIGNGTSSIAELIEKENERSERGSSSEQVLAKIIIDGTTRQILGQRGMDLETVLPEGERLFVKDTANISSGGTSEDVTDEVHPANKFMVERIARLFNLNICGVDIMATSVTEPITKSTGAIIEVNAGPGLRMHSNPQKGTPRDIASPILDMLYPDHTAWRIPIVAVTGTNGKTTTTRLIAHLAQAAGKHPGFCTTDGIYIDGHLLYRGDCTGSVSAQSVLFDPSIDFAVLECARGGIIRAGLGFEESDIAVITNITEDHLGLKDIHTIGELSRVKEVVAKTVKEDGYAVLNAEDDRVYAFYERLRCKKALFSISPHNNRLKEHVARGGVAASIEQNNIVIYHRHRTVVEDIRKVPLSFDGRAEMMIGNILAAVLAAYLSGFDLKNIRNGLASFMPSPELTPGRMNLFDFGHFRLMVDYAHNSDGFEQVKKFIKKIEDHPKVGIISIAGDRRPADIEAVGRLTAQMFDTLIIRSNKDSRGMGEDRVYELLRKGAESVSEDRKVLRIKDEMEALEYAVMNAEKGSFIFVCADKVPLTLDYVKELQEKYQQLKKAI